jgi:hypothetical protein
MKYSRRTATAVLFLVVCLLAPPRAEAYLDPGSGSYVLQLLIAGFLSTLYFIKTYWNRIKVFISKIFSKPKDDIE